MLYGTKDGLRKPASSVSEFLDRRADDLPREERSFRLMAAGYETNSAKAVAFVEAETPDMLVPRGNRDAVAEKARDFVAAADEVERALRLAVKIALYGEDAKVARNATPLTSARDRFWADTNDRFFAILNEVSTWPEDDLAGGRGTPMAQTWRSDMERSALAIFDDMAPMEDALSADVRRVVEGRRSLVRTLLGYGARGIELFKNLQLPAPEAKARKGKAA
jgi:hypothetical protein